MSYEEAVKICQSWIKDHLPWKFKCWSTEEDYDSSDWILFYYGTENLTLSIKFEEDSIRDWQLETE